MDTFILRKEWLSLFHEPNTSTLLLLCLFLFSVLYFLQKTRRNSLKLPPSPPGLPLIGNFHQITGQLHRSLSALSARHGCVILLQLASQPTVVVSSADAHKEIMSQEAFASRPQTAVSKILFFGSTDILFSSYGEYWRKARRVCVSQLLCHKRVMEFRTVREAEISRMIEDIRGLCRKGAELDMAEMFGTLSNDIICRCALGRVYKEGNGKRSSRELLQSVSDITSAFCFQQFFTPLAFLDHIFGSVAKWRRIANEVHTFLDQLIEEHVVSDGTDGESDARDLVDILLRLQKYGGNDISLTRENIIAILLDMFFAGTDTTAAAMEWAMAELMKSPRTLEKAQEEVRKVVGGKLKIDEYDLSQLKYLKRVLKETLRLHPVLLARQTNTAAKLAGYDIPPNTTVFVNTWAIHRDPKTWDRPEEFIPERFVDVPIDFGGKDKDFIPFGAGRRSCPGLLFSTIEAEHALASLLYWFDWKLPGGASPEHLDMDDSFGAVIRKKVPLSVVPVMHSFS